LFGRKSLSDLGDIPIPRVFLLATNLTHAGVTCFGATELIHVPIGGNEEPQRIDATLTPIALAAAISSAFPGFFPPVQLRSSDVGAEETNFGPQYFTDGGVGDNLGLHGLAHIDHSGLFDLVVASDAGRSFVPPKREESFGYIRTALRATDLMMFRMREMELRGAQLIRGRKLCKISISERVENAGSAPQAVQQRLESIRTDFDSFSTVEIDELRRHGFFVAQKCLGNAGLPDALGEENPWVPNYLDDGDPSRQARSLQRGERRKMRLFALSDWMSWVQVAMVIAALGFCAALVKRRIDKALDPLQANLQKTEASLKVIGPPPARLKRDMPMPTIVTNLVRPMNTGFDIERDSRVWDLRQLEPGPKVEGGNGIVGPALMTRTMVLKRILSSAKSYGFWFQSSGSEFSAWPLNAGFPLKLLTQQEPTLSGHSLLKPWELRLDVSNQPIGELFVLSVQSETKDSFRSRQNWWVGMSITDRVDEASMRVIFPRSLPFKRPVFKKYPNDTPLEADVFEGIVLEYQGEHELLWSVRAPLPGWTYRVEWLW